MSESVLVTGGSGFIGAWVLRELLSRGLRPVVYDVQKNEQRWQCIVGNQAGNIAYVPGDLTDRSQLRRVVDEFEVTRVIHLAALLTPDCQQDPYRGCEVNVLGSVALFEIVREFAGQIQGVSYASSFAVYGPEADDGPLGISTADNRPPSFYGAFKLAVDAIAEQYWRHFGVASVGIRPHVVYGPERRVGLTAGPSMACRAAALGEAYTIPYTGRVGYDYIEEVARAFVQSALKTPPGSRVVDLQGQLATTQQFLDIIERVVPGASSRITIDGPPIPSNIPPKPNYISNLFQDWRTTTLEDGVRMTVDFYRKSL